MIESVLFVCLGNICRSPIAEGVAKKLIAQKGLDIEIDSAGTGDWHIGEPPCENSIKVAKLHGIDISTCRARKVQPKDFEKFDLIVALDSSNMKALEAMGAKNVVKLGQYGYNNEDVPDPYFFHGFEGFEKVYTMIETCVTNLIDSIEKGKK